MDVDKLLGRLAKADFADALGIAVSSESVAAAHLRKRLQTVRVLSVASQQIAGPAEARWAEILDFLRSFAQTHGAEGARIGVALDRRDALLGHLQLPATAGDTLDRVVGYELDRVIPVPADALYTAYYSRPIGTAGERIAVVVVAAYRDRVEEVYEQLATVGLAPGAVTTDAVALNDYAFFCCGEPGGIVGIFHPDGEREAMLLCCNGLMISSLHSDPRPAGRGEWLHHEVERLLPEHAEWEAMVVAESNPGPEEHTLASLLPAGFVPEAYEPTRLEATAIGAALSCLGEARARVNLLPADRVQAEEGVGLREMALAACVVILGAVLAGSIAVKNLTISSALADEITQLTPLVTKVTGEEAANRRLMERIQALEKHRATSVLSYLRAMTDLVPRTAYLTTFRYKGDRLEVDGIASNASELISILERSPYFKDVEFTAPTTKYLQSKERFSLRLGLER